MTVQKTKVLPFVAIAAAAMVWSMPVGVDGQAAKAPAPAASKRAIPRLADGHPDLQGTYDLATLTPVERRAGSPLVMSDEEAVKLERQAAARREQLGAPIDGNRAAPPVGGDGSAGAAGNVGGYNNFWIDAGSRYTVIDGSGARRSSSIRPTAACRR